MARGGRESESTARLVSGSLTFFSIVRLYTPTFCSRSRLERGSAFVGSPQLRLETYYPAPRFFGLLASTNLCTHRSSSPVIANTPPTTAQVRVRKCRNDLRFVSMRTLIGERS